MRCTSGLTPLLCIFLLACAVGAGNSETSTAGAGRLVGLVAPNLDPAAAAGLVMPFEAAGDREFMDKAWLLMLRRDPETVGTLGLAKPLGLPEDELTDVSDAAALGTRELYLALVAAIDRRAPESDAANRLALASLRRWLVDRARLIEFSLDAYPVHAVVNSADWLTTNYFTEILDPRDEASARLYIRLLGKVPAKFDGLRAAISLRAEHGVILPRFLLDRALTEIRETGSGGALSNPYYTAFAARLDKAGLPPAKREALLAEAAAAVEADIIPPFAALADTLMALRPRAPASGGASNLPGGAAFYSACLAAQTTTEAQAADIHATGLRELARVQAEIRAGFARLGYSKEAPLRQLYARLDGEAGRAGGPALLDFANSLIRGMDARLGEIVITKPRLGVEVVFGEQGGYYQQPAADGSRPGRYFLARDDYRSRSNLASTLYHETLPGHHLQIAKALEADLALFSRMADFNGYIEGWALYAEELASEMGVYKDDPKVDLYRLQMKALRAARLVADTGVNAERWDFRKAADFISDSTGLDPGFAQYESMRYHCIPAQATAYYLGFLEILSLREKARLALGQKFDLRRFHEAVLGNGALPLDVLATVVDGYIATEAAR